MIRINILPEERRRKEKTPLPRFLAMNAAIIVCLLLGVWNVWMYFDIKGQSDILKSSKEELADLQKQTANYNKLLADEKKLAEWNSAATQIKNTREFYWWEKVDELWDVIYSAKDIWITSFNASETAPSSVRGKAQVSAAISMGCFATGMSSDRMTSFRMRLKSHPKLKETFNLGINDPPQFTVVAQPQFKEEFAVRFDIDMSRKKETKK
jgi:hypothetical protein